MLDELRDDARSTIRTFAEEIRASRLIESAHFVEARLEANPRVRRFKTLTSLQQLI